MPSLAGIPVAIAIASGAAMAFFVSAFATTNVVVPVRTHAPALLQKYIEMVYDKHANIVTGGIWACGFPCSSM